MIVPMKKVYIVVQSKDVTDALKKLRKIGAVHIEHQSELKNQEIQELKNEVSMFETVLNVLKQYQTKDTIQQVASGNLDARCELILERLALVEDYQEGIVTWQKRIDKWEAWGDFNPKDIHALEEKGVYVQLIEVPTNHQEKIPDDIVLHELSQTKKISRFIAFSLKPIKLPFKSVKLPTNSLTEMVNARESDRKKLLDIQHKLQENARYMNHVTTALKTCREELSFVEAAAGMKIDESLAVLKGFCPQKFISKVESKAKEQHWGLVVDDVSEDDQVPTMLENAKWVDLSKPALNMIEILPGYKEMDVSAVFMIFFTLFFAMLIGDAAYGAIFAIGTLIVQKKIGKKMKDKTPFYLMYLLSGFTIVWGVLTATYFGQLWLPANVKPLVPWLNDFQNVQWLCFTIALVHLSIARIWAAKVKLPSITALSQVGWLMIVWGMYFMANMFVLNKPMPSFAVPLIFSGMALALFFMFPFNEFIKKVPQEIIPFILGVVGAGTDIISYIRLFAVGLATVAVADAANGMPAALPGGPGIAFMIFLHVLNLILASMAILVHAIRLNVLEFSGHMGLEWTGVKYSPFKKNIQHA